MTAPETLEESDSDASLPELLPLPAQVPAELPAHVVSEEAPVATALPTDASVPPLLSIRSVKVFYFFAGEVRRGDIQEWMVKTAPKYSLLINFTEIDLLKGGAAHDLSDPCIRDACLEALGTADIVFCTPPCSSFSRSQWSNSFGPPPLRSFMYPKGFPWLASGEKAKIELANTFISFTWKVLHKVQAISASRFCLGFTEHPEDLGAVKKWDPASRPASIWQSEEARKMVSDFGWTTCAFYQGPYGGITVKPTRILFNHNAFSSMGPTAWPSFGPDMGYIGPLPRMANAPGSKNILRQPGETGPFRTAALSAYPSELCRTLAEAALSAFAEHCAPPAHLSVGF